MHPGKSKVQSDARERKIAQIVTSSQIIIYLDKPLTWDVGKLPGKVYMRPLL